MIDVWAQDLQQKAPIYCNIGFVMKNVWTKEQIKNGIDPKICISEIEKGFVAYSQNRTTIAPVSSLTFQAPPADVHIKSGTMEGSDFYVVKIASGFYDNPKIGLNSSNGLMILFSKKTGELEAVLLDEGMLTDTRTAIAGAIAAKHMAKKKIQKIGIIGTGIQAREQLYYLQFVTDCRNAMVWGRDKEKVEKYVNDEKLSSFSIDAALSIDELAEQCDLIVTTTPSTKALLFGAQIQPGTHITAVGADHQGKQELDASVFEKADLICVDSLLQCSKYGDYSHALHLGLKNVMELGTLIANPPHREEDAITVADLTGVAFQDLQIATAVLNALKGR